MAGLQEGALAGLGLELQGKIHHPNSCIRWMLQTEATTEWRGGEESSGVPLDGNKSPCTSEAPTEWETTELIPAETLLASLGAFKGRTGERSSSRSSCVKDCGWRVCKPHLNKGEQMCYRVTRICNTLMKAKAVYGAIMRSTKKRKRLRRGHMEQSWWRVMSGGF